MISQAKMEGGGVGRTLKVPGAPMKRTFAAVVRQFASGIKPSGT